MARPLFRRFSHSQRGHPLRLRHAHTIRRIGPGAVVNMALLDVSRSSTHHAGRVPHLLLGWGHLAEQVARLLPLVVIHAVVPMRSVAVSRHQRFGEVWLFFPQIGAVEMDAQRATQIAVRAHLPVAMIAVIRAFRRVHRDG